MFSQLFTSHFGLRYSSQYSFCFFICMHIIRSTPERESKPPALLGFVHLRISLFFRKLFCLVFFTVMILFRMLLNRNMWMNPISNMMGGWWIWEKQSDGTVTLTTECFENIALMLPFTFSAHVDCQKRKLLKSEGQTNLFYKYSLV